MALASGKWMTRTGLGTMLQVTCALIGVTIGRADRATAQARGDATLIPKGLLRIEFAPLVTNYDRRFSLGSSGLSDGSPEPIGADLTADEAGSFMFPAIEPSERAVAAIIDDPAYHMNVGAFKTVRDTDIRRFPFQLSFGLTDRITVAAKVPIVTHRSQVTFTTDETDANVGYNLANATLGDPQSAAAATAVIAELSAAVMELQARIAGGDFGCPSSTQCASAQATLARATAIRDNLSVFLGPESPVNGLPSFAPLATSTAGLTLTSAITTVASELTALGVTSVSSTFPLPTEPLTTDDVQSLLTDQTVGYAAAPVEFIRGTGLGDVEVSLQLGVIQTSAARVVVTGTVRLPTGKVDLANNFVDLGTGDAQTDIVAGVEAVLGGGDAHIAFGGSFTLQLSDQLTRRVGPSDRPLLPLSSETTVSRDLGDILWLAAYPSLRLSDIFTVYGTISYYHKGEDHFSNPGETSSLLFPVESLDLKTSMRTLSIGGGIAYRTAYKPDGGMPIEAGLSYQSAFNGSGGLTPKANVLNLYLRLFYNLFAPKTASPTQPPP
jgi:hypothetical protein